jgi:hypothetical protein
LRAFGEIRHGVVAAIAECQWGFGAARSSVLFVTMEGQAVHESDGCDAFGAGMFCRHAPRSALAALWPLHLETGHSRRSFLSASTAEVGQSATIQSERELFARRRLRFAAE